MKTQIMIDIETLGSNPYSAIVSLGAVMFGSGRISKEFYQRIDPQSCVDIGLTMDVSTVLWWMKQNDLAREELNKPAESIGTVLLKFNDWVCGSDPEVWGNGSDFDNMLLACAYRKAQIIQPWKFYNNRCYRTIKSLKRYIPIQRIGVHHNALDDARSQAEHLMKILPGI